MTTYNIHIMGPKAGGKSSFIKVFSTPDSFKRNYTPTTEIKTTTIQVGKKTIIFTEIPDNLREKKMASADMYVVLFNPTEDLDNVDSYIKLLTDSNRMDKVLLLVNKIDKPAEENGIDEELQERVEVEGLGSQPGLEDKRKNNKYSCLKSDDYYPSEPEHLVRMIKKKLLVRKYNEKSDEKSDEEKISLKKQWKEEAVEVNENTGFNVDDFLASDPTETVKISPKEKSKSKSREKEFDINDFVSGPTETVNISLKEKSKSKSKEKETKNEEEEEYDDEYDEFEIDMIVEMKKMKNYKEPKDSPKEEEPEEESTVIDDEVVVDVADTVGKLDFKVLKYLPNGREDIPFPKNSIPLKIECKYPFSLFSASRNDSDGMFRRYSYDPRLNNVTELVIQPNMLQVFLEDRVRTHFRLHFEKQKGNINITYVERTFENLCTMLSYSVGTLHTNEREGKNVDGQITYIKALFRYMAIEFVIKESDEKTKREAYAKLFSILYRAYSYSKDSGVVVNIYPRTKIINLFARDKNADKMIDGVQVGDDHVVEFFIANAVRDDEQHWSSPDREYKDAIEIVAYEIIHENMNGTARESNFNGEEKENQTNEMEKEQEEDENEEQNEEDENEEQNEEDIQESEEQENEEKIQENEEDINQYNNIRDIYGEEYNDNEYEYVQKSTTAPTTSHQEMIQYTVPIIGANTEIKNNELNISSGEGALNDRFEDFPEQPILTKQPSFRQSTGGKDDSKQGSHKQIILTRQSIQDSISSSAGQHSVRSDGIMDANMNTGDLSFQDDLVSPPKISRQNSARNSAHGSVRNSVRDQSVLDLKHEKNAPTMTYMHAITSPKAFSPRAASVKSQLSRQLSQQQLSHHSLQQQLSQHHEEIKERESTITADVVRQPKQTVSLVTRIDDDTDDTLYYVRKSEDNLFIHSIQRIITVSYKGRKVTLHVLTEFIPNTDEQILYFDLSKIATIVCNSYRYNRILSIADGSMKIISRTAYEPLAILRALSTVEDYEAVDRFMECENMCVKQHIDSMQDEIKGMVCSLMK